MDILVIGVVLSLAILGAFWGLVRLFSVVLALTGAAILGRLAGPPLAELVFSPDPTGAQKLLASAVAGALAAGLMLLAGFGFRRLLQSLHLAFLDRVLGALATGGLALILVALLLGLAAMGGVHPGGRLSSQLAQFGQGVLAVYKLSTSNPKPSTSPSKPTSNGQHPEEP